MSHKIAITGATGKLGQLVIEALLSRGVPGAQIIAVARRPEALSELSARGVDVREGDYNRPEALTAALAGADRVLLISSNDLGQRVAQHLAVIDAAKAAGAARIVYTSLLRADTSAMILAGEHKPSEDAIRASGLAFTILRNGWYIENYTDNLANALAHGALIGSAGDGRIAAATREDFARAAAAVLTTDGHAGKTYELNGDAAFTMRDLAEAVSAWAGRPIAYIDMPQSDYQGALAGAGVPAGFAAILADADTAIRAGALEAVGDDLRRLLGAPTTTLQAALAALPRP
jgi:NAD(P)H dehydrogenase (quinone)